jgi:hypothetical protein
LFRFSAWSMFIYSRHMFICTSSSTLSAWCRWSCYCLCWLCKRKMSSWNMQIFSSTWTSCCTIKSSKSTISCSCSTSFFEYRSCYYSIFTINNTIGSFSYIE